MNLTDRLVGKHVDLTHAAAPATVKSDDGRDREVVAAAFIPPGDGQNPVHIVVYNRGDDELIAPDDQHWAVGINYWNPTLGIHYLAHGDYDMTFAQAMVRFVERVERQG